MASLACRPCHASSVLWKTHFHTSLLQQPWCAWAGARLAFGGKPLEGHTIPEVYGAIQPTAVFVPIDQLVKDEHFGLATTEVFGPFQACPLLSMHV